MNNWLVGEEFSLIYPYAIALNTIFVTLLFSSGIPILLWFGTLSLFLQYWSWKYLLLRYNKSPPAYDYSLNK